MLYSALFAHELSCVCVCGFGGGGGIKSFLKYSWTHNIVSFRHTT